MAVTDPVTIVCSDGGITFTIPERFDKALREDHRDFYCPNGHRLSYGGPSRADRLSEALEAERRHRLAVQRDAEDRRRQLAAARGQITQLRKRLDPPQEDTE